MTVILARDADVTVHVGEYQYISGLKRQPYDQLREQISRQGVIVPVVVTQNGTIVDGHHRWQIAQELGVTDLVPVDVREYASDAAAQADAVGLNVYRRQMEKAERDRWIAQLRALGLTQREIAAQVGLSQSRVSEISPSLSPSDKEGEIDPLETAKAKPRTFGRKFTPAEKAAIQAEVERLHAAGMKVPQIAEEIGLAPSAVWRRLRPPPSDEPKPDLIEQLRELATQGMTSVQIADQLGRSAEWVRVKRNQHDIDIPADRASHKKRIDANAAMERAVGHLSDALFGFEFIAVDDLDPRRADEWSRSLGESARAIRTLIRQLNQLTKEQDQ